MKTDEKNDDIVSTIVKYCKIFDNTSKEGQLFFAAFLDLNHMHAYWHAAKKSTDSYQMT